MKKAPRSWLRVLRRGVALALALTAAWFLSLTADFSLPGPEALWGSPALAVSLLSSQLPAAPPSERALTGWPRLLLGQSPLLAAAEDAILAQTDAPEAEEPDDDPQEAGAHDSDDQEPPELAPQETGDGILEMTARGKTGGKYLYGEGVYLYNRTDQALDASVASAGTVDVSLGDGPQILIVHTHGSEAYSQSDGDLYQESDPYRTTDCTHNVVRVGEEIATVFRAHGFQVVHDTTLFDYPAYNGAYGRSQAAVEQWLQKYPTIQVVLDVHRDALVGANGEVYKLVSQEAGEKVAQVMLVVGGNHSGGHPRWRDNLAFAVRLQQNLTRGYDALARPIVLRSSSYNQQLLPGSLLVEFGGHGNTLSEALGAARLWADNVARTLTALREG